MSRRKSKSNDDYSQDLPIETMALKSSTDKNIKDVSCTPSCSEGPGPECEEKQNGNGGNGSNGNGRKYRNGNGENIKLETIPPDPRWPNANVVNIEMSIIDYIIYKINIYFLLDIIIK